MPTHNPTCEICPKNVRHPAGEYFQRNADGRVHYRELCDQHLVALRDGDGLNISPITPELDKLHAQQYADDFPHRA